MHDLAWSFLKHAWCMLEACLKRAWCVLEACLKDAWSVLEACLKPAWSVLEACLKLAWRVFGACLRAWSVLEACLKLTWSVLEACLKWVWSVLALNTLKHSKYIKVKKGDRHADEWTEWHLHFLSCSSQLKIAGQKNFQVKKFYGRKHWWKTGEITGETLKY